jgi:hypothetical protein
MAVTSTIFRTLTRTRQYFVSNCHAEFHENLTNGSDADSVSRTDVVSKQVPFYFVKNAFLFRKECLSV